MIINTDHNQDKYTTTQEFNKFTSENVAARLAQTNSANKNDIANFLKKKSFDDKLKKLNKTVISNKTGHAIVENELNELQRNWSYINKRTNQRLDP